MTKKDVPSFGDIIKQAKSGSTENQSSISTDSQKDVKPEMQSVLSTEVQKLVEPEVGKTGLLDQKSGDTVIDESIQTEAGTEVSKAGLLVVEQSGSTAIEKSVKPSIGNYVEPYIGLSVKMDVNNTRSKEVHTVNITIKTTEARRNHWAAEAKRRRTTMTSVMVEALIAAFGDAPDDSGV